MIKERFGSLFGILICLLFVGCFKRYKGTVGVCDNTLYVEDFQVNPAGVYFDYLTDSTNFRIYIGKFDPENDFYSYQCKGDSVFIEKIQIYETVGTTSYKRVNKVIENKGFDLKELRRKHLFE